MALEFRVLWFLKSPSREEPDISLSITNGFASGFSVDLVKE